MMITSDHRGFAGGQLPKVRPTPASIRSPELGSPSRDSPPMSSSELAPGCITTSTNKKPIPDEYRLIRDRLFILKNSYTKGFTDAHLYAWADTITLFLPDSFA